MTVITDMDKRVAQEIQGDIPLDKRPFDAIGKRIGIKGSDVIDILKKLQKEGIMRRFGAVLRHREAGFPENAMVVWAVPEERCEEVGSLLASYKAITHCYERTPSLEGIYNLFTMVHLAAGEDEEKTVGKDRMEELIGRVSSAIGVGDYKIFRSLEEFKKNSMEYF
ncbi:MAG: Lrp/AsnC family transcriptional regulator [Deltaproteobacteria bacterium]|nr:Lrp/AsnC family transcriptional regulator [Deltaproteobacteria bacterium]